METATAAVLDAAILLENTLSKLYNHFSVKIPDHRDFWFEMQLEEKNHALLLKTIKEFAAIGKLPEDILLEGEDEYLTTIQEINGFIKTIKNINLSAACEFAHKIETTSGEIHFQQAMTRKDPDNITRIFKRLNAMDINHAQRIWDYWHTQERKKT